MAGAVTGSIRAAGPADIADIVGLSMRLAAATRQPLPPDPALVAGFVGNCLAAGPEVALVLVADRRWRGGLAAMLVATVSVLPLSGEPVAIEHGWYAEPGSGPLGGLLVRRYLGWARARGVAAVRLSAPPDAGLSAGLARLGFRAAETAFVKRMAGG